jgi:hypothetical protein
MSLSDYFVNTEQSPVSPIANRFQNPQPSAPVDNTIPNAGNVPPLIQNQPIPQQTMLLKNQIPNYNLGNSNRYTYNPGAFSLDWSDILKRAVKYLLEGLAVAFVAYYFTHGKLDMKEVIMLGITAAFVFAILDTFSPTVSLGLRFGAGFGIGQTMFGVAPGMVGAAKPAGVI